MPNAIAYTSAHAAAGLCAGSLLTDVAQSWLLARYPLDAAASGDASVPVAVLAAVAMAAAATLAWHAPRVLGVGPRRTARVRAATLLGALLSSFIFATLSLGQAIAPLVALGLAITPAAALAHATHWLVAGLVLAQVIALGGLFAVRELLAPSVPGSRWDRLGYAGLNRDASRA